MRIQEYGLQYDSEIRPLTGGYVLHYGNCLGIATYRNAGTMYLSVCQQQCDADQPRCLAYQHYAYNAYTPCYLYDQPVTSDQSSSSIACYIGKFHQSKCRSSHNGLRRVGRVQSCACIGRPIQCPFFPRWFLKGGGVVSVWPGGRSRSPLFSKWGEKKF